MQTNRHSVMTQFGHHLPKPWALYATSRNLPLQARVFLLHTNYVPPGAEAPLPPSFPAWTLASRFFPNCTVGKENQKRVNLQGVGCAASAFLLSRYYSTSTPLLFAEEPALPRTAPFLPGLAAARIGSAGPRPRSSPNARSSRANPAMSPQPHTAPRDRRHRQRRQRGPRSNERPAAPRGFRASLLEPRSERGRAQGCPAPPHHPRDPPHAHSPRRRAFSISGLPAPGQAVVGRVSCSPAGPSRCAGTPCPTAPSARGGGSAPPHPAAQPPPLKAQRAAPTRHRAEPRRCGPQLLGVGLEKAAREDRPRQLARRAPLRSLAAAVRGRRPYASGGSDVRSRRPRGATPAPPSLPASEERLSAVAAHLREGKSGGSPPAPPCAEPPRCTAPEAHRARGSSLLQRCPRGSWQRPGIATSLPVAQPCADAAAEVLQGTALKSALCCTSWTRELSGHNLFSLPSHPSLSLKLMRGKQSIQLLRTGRNSAQEVDAWLTGIMGGDGQKNSEGLYLVTACQSVHYHIKLNKQSFAQGSTQFKSQANTRQKGPKSK